MESNNHFNYGTHSSANSGLKLSSGDSLYANGSSASFPQQGKNINGEINVNGTTTVLGSGVPSSLPPTAPYPRVSSHQQSSRGYEYLWGGHPQYGPSMGTSAGHGLHQKQPAAGMAQPQSQHHFQGHGQYQLNGSVEGSHQPPLAGPPNVPLPGSQFWNRSNPGPQQVGYSIYGTYQSQTQHGITPPHHQQSSHPTLHQPSQQHLQSHRSPHHHQQHQQPQHYGMIPNGMPLYQHQPQHLTMSSQQQQQQQQQPPQSQSQSQSQSQCQLIPAADRSFTPPHGSPQHHSSGRATTGSPLPEGISSATVMSPSKGLDSESPKVKNRDGKKPSVIQGNTMDSVTEDDTSYNGSEKAATAQKLPKTDVPSSKPPATYVGSSSDFQQNSDQSAAQSPEMVSSIKDAPLNPPAGFASSQLSKSSSPGTASTTLTTASVPLTGSGPPSSVSSTCVESAQSQMSVSLNVSSVQSPSSPSGRSSPGLSPPPSEMYPAGPKSLSARPSSSTLPTSPPKLSTPLALSTSEPRPASSSHPAVISSSESVIRPSPLPPVPSGPGTAVSASAPITSLQQMVQGSYMSHNSISSSAQHNRPHPPKLISTIASVGSSNPSAAVVQSSSSTPAAVTPSVEHKPTAPVLMSHFRARTPPPLKSGLSPAAPALLSDVSPPPPGAHTSPKVQSLPTLPLLNTQASRTALSSAPHALMSLPPGKGLSSQMVQQSRSQQRPPNTSACVKLPPNPECCTTREESRVSANNRNEKAEEQLCHPQSISATPQEVEMAESRNSGPLCHRSFSDLPGKPFQTAASSDPAAGTKQEDLRGAGVCETEDSVVEPTTIRKLSQLHSSRGEHLTEHSFTSSVHAAPQPDNGHSPPKAEASLVRGERSAVDGDSSWVSDSDGSFQLRNETSEYHSSYYTKGETSTAFDTTRDSNLSTEDSREDTLDSTREEESSEEEETGISRHAEGESTLSSTFNSTAQTEEPSVDASDGSKSALYKTPHIGHEGPGPEWGETKGHETPDVAGRMHVKPPADESSPLPTFNLRDENFTFSTPVDSRGLQPVPAVTDQNPTAAEEPQAAGGKPRKQRTSKTLWIKTPVPVEAQRKPRVRTPKAEKISSEVERPAGTKRRKSFRVDAADKSSDVPGEAATQTKEVDSITATIEAVLASASAVSPAFQKMKKVKRVKKEEQDGNAVKAPDQKAEDAEENDDGSTTGETNRRRVATEEQVQFALLHGWKREIRVRKKENRMKGETWYYTPCGRRMKQFPEILKYLKKHTDSVVTREHFSFSPRMPVGDFYEERETAEGMKWFILANEEVPSMIMAITGRRGRPPNPDKEKPRRVRGVRGGEGRRPGRPPKTKMIDLLTKVDAKLLQRLEAKEALTEEEKEKLAKIKKKMKKKARIKRREEAKMKKMKEEKKRARIKIKLEQDTKGVEAKADNTSPTSPRAALPPSEPKKPGRRRSVKVEPPPVQQTDEERIAQGKRVLGARSKAKALAKAQAEAEAAAEAAARAALSAKRAAERRAQAQRRMEERKRQQLIAEELKKPTEDMCLTDHKPLPELSRIPGVVLSGAAFSHCLAVVEFLHGYGKLIGLNVPKDIPSLSTLQEGLLGLGEGQGEVQDLLIKLVEAALHDPGLPTYYQSVKILGEKLVDLELTRSTVSEPLRIFLESHGYETEVCNTLRTKTFHSLPPDTKAAILGFLVDELNGSNAVTSDIDNTLENMATYRKNKWIIEGKLRRLKAALARRTGRSEEELCFEERRRSARVAEEENLSLEEGGTERGNRRARKEEPKISDIESPTNASIPELERQIDKLTKRQAFFRKKLQQSSQSMRAILLGQDRFQRRYTAFPHLGGVLVEGPEELLASGDVLIAEVPVTFFKKEPKAEDAPVPTSASPPASPSALPLSPMCASPSENQTLSPEVDPLPGTASLMSRPRGRGRPRKIKPEVELHLRTAKSRRRRRSSVRSGSDEGPGSPNICPQDLTQTAFQSWLSQTQETLANGTCPAAEAAAEGSGPEESKKELAEKQGQWFNVLPKQPCDDTSLTELQVPSSPPKLQLSDPPSTPAPPPEQQDPPLPVLAPSDPVIPATPPDIPPTTVDSVVPVTTSPTPPPPPPPPPPPSLPPPPPPSLPLLQPLAAPIPSAPVAPNTPTRPGRRRRRGSRGNSPARRGPRGAAAKRRGRPPGAVFQELEQQYFTQLVVKPIPVSMVRGWWWIKDQEELYSTLQALHPRGIRERVLHKHLAKHMESLTEMCSKSMEDPIFEMKVEQKDTLMEALQQPWLVQEKAMETDVCALQWVEDLEQRVVGADLQLKAPPQSTSTDADANLEAAIAEFQPYTIPEPDSTRDDLQYYEHDADPRDDWILRTKKEWSGLPRIATHPLDLAVLRLANLERNIERRYLKEPLWNPAEVMRLAPLTPTPGEEQPLDALSLESEITSRLRTWRQALDRCRSAPQLCLCLLQLEKAIAWERSVTKVTCQICRKGDNDDCLLLCDGCDRGCHMYCLRPKLTQVPEGDWFCATCVAREEGQFERLSKTRTRIKKRKKYDESSSEEEPTTRRSCGMSTRNKDVVAPSSSSSSSSSLRPASESSASKRRRMTTRNLPDLTFCEIILMEMEAHADAWPFLEPVNPRLVPGYRRIIKNPMDFLTMRERLLQGGYSSCDEFAADAQLVFNNCELFNEDTSEVGMAGHSMRRFFESRWAEFYSKKDK